MNARIRWKGYNRKESEKIRQFLPIAHYFAKRWKKPVILDAPEGNIVPYTTNDEEKRIYIHFFARHPCDTSIHHMMAHATVLFALPVPHDNLTIQGQGEATRVSGNDAAALIRNCNKHKGAIDSPEHTIAFVLLNHIYILPNIAYRPWDGAEIVFWEICENATRRLPLEDETIGNIADRFVLCENMRKTFLKKRKNMESAFNTSALHLLKKRSRALYARAIKQRAQKEDLERKFQNVLSRIALFEHILEKPREEEFQKGFLVREFERILSLQHVLGVKIENDYTELHVYTKPISRYDHTGSRDPQPLAQYKIIINMTDVSQQGQNKFNGIRICEWGWLGPYRHPERDIQHCKDGTPHIPCFGGKLSQSIKKSFLDHDYFTLIHRILCYLDSDGRQPQQRKPEDQSRKEYKEKPFYTPQYTINNAIHDYTKFVKKFRGEFREQSLKRLLADARTEQEKLNKKFRTMRENIALLDHARIYLARYLDAIDCTHQQDLFFGMPSLITARITPHFLWAVFGPGKGAGAFEHFVFPGTMRILIIPGKGIIRAWGSAHDNPKSGGFFLAFVDRDGTVTHSEDVHLLMSQGRLGEAIHALYDHLRGRAFSEAQAASEEIKENIREKTIAYLEKTSIPCMYEPSEEEKEDPMEGYVLW